MKEFFKQYYPNLTIFTISLIFGINKLVIQDIEEPKNLIAALLFFTLLLCISYLYNKGSIKNKYYPFGNLYKIIADFILITIVIISAINSKGTSGWDSIGIYGIFYLSFTFLVITTIFNIITKISSMIIFRKKGLQTKYSWCNIIKIVLSTITIIVAIIFYIKLSLL